MIKWRPLSHMAWSLIPSAILAKTYAMENDALGWIMACVWLVFPGMWFVLSMAESRQSTDS